jgi:hypothetical protein
VRKLKPRNAGFFLLPELLLDDAIGATHRHLLYMTISGHIWS